MVAAAREWAGFHVADAKGRPEHGPALELGWLHPARHRKVVAGGSQVLADGDDVDAHRGEVGQQTVDLLHGLAEADHQTRLDGEASRLRPSEHRQAAGVPGRGSHGALQTGHGLDVVVEHVGARIEQQLQRRIVALGIAHQGLHGGARASVADGVHARSNVGETAVGEIVAGHHREHRVLQVAERHRRSHPTRLAGVGSSGLLRVNQAEAAGTGAALPQHHERRRTGGPAFAEVRATGLLADRHQAVVAHGLLHRQHIGTQPHSRAQPLGLALGDRQAFGHPRSFEASQRSARGTGPFATRERGEVVGNVLPGNVLPLHGAVAPAGRSTARHDGGDGLQRHLHAFLGERRDRLVADAARHDVLAHVAHIGLHVQCEAVHRAVVSQPHSDGADLARVGAAHAHPHAGVLVETADVGDTQLLQRTHDKTLEGAHMVAGTQRIGHVHNGVPDQLTRAVVRHVATTLHAHQLGTHRRRVDEHIGGQVGPRAVGEHVRVLEQQQMVERAVLEHRLLQCQRFAIRHAPEPADAQRTGGDHG